MNNILKCDLCDADAGDDPYHVTMDGNGHVHICAACFKPDHHHIAVLKQQYDELLKTLQNVLRWMPVFPKSADGIVGARESYQKALEAARASSTEGGNRNVNWLTTMKRRTKSGSAWTGLSRAKPL